MHTDPHLERHENIKGIYWDSYWFMDFLIKQSLSIITVGELADYKRMNQSLNSEYFMSLHIKCTVLLGLAS